MTGRSAVPRADPFAVLWRVMVAGSCPVCGASVAASAGFCTQCGSQMPSVAPSPLPAPPGATSKGNGRNRLYVLIALGVAVLLVGGALVATSGDKDGTVETASGEVFLEPADFTSDAPFTESVDTNTAPPPVQLADSSPSPSATVSPSPSVPGTVGVRSVEGAAPGLYGGTQDESSCDADRLVAFLTEEPAKARAWAAVQGIAPEDIPAFVASLTPIVLRADTRVTNHGYEDGRATPFQAVLQAGTAVLVDDLGIPRVKCGCGNPLAAPVAQTGGVRFTGQRWPAFRPRSVIVIVNTNVIRVKEFVLVDLVRPGFFVRPVGIPAPGGLPADETILIDRFCDMFPEQCRPPDLDPGGAIPPPRPGEPALGTGDVQVTLRWNSTADLDLAVIDPNGETVNFDTPTSSSGGQLDVDSNAECAAPTTTPVENVFWPPGQSPDGDYTIIVSYFGECPGGAGPQTFELSVLMGGAPVDVQTVALGPEDASVIELLVDRSGPGPDLRPLATSGTLNAPGDQVSGLVSKTGGGGQVPPAPTDLSAAGSGSGTVTLVWLPDPDALATTTGYEITIEPGGQTFLVNPGEVSFDVPGLEPGTQYSFSIVAYNQFGRSGSVTASSKSGEGPVGTTGSATGATGGQQPPQETLEEYCNREYDGPPQPGEVNMMWTLCMHDPTSDSAVSPGALPQPVDFEQA